MSFERKEMLKLTHDYFGDGKSYRRLKVIKYKADVGIYMTNKDGTKQESAMYFLDNNELEELITALQEAKS